jgi:antitoxin PrlF
MPLSRSKVTSQGQISVPAEVRRKLGVGPGSILEWEEEGGQIIVRRAGTFSSEDIHQAVFHGKPPEPKTLDEMKEGLRRRVLERYAHR